MTSGTQPVVTATDFAAEIIRMLIAQLATFGVEPACNSDLAIERLEALAAHPTVSGDEVDWLLGDELNGGFVRDMCFTLWSLWHDAWGQNPGEVFDWSNDTLPTVQAGVAEIRQRLAAISTPPDGLREALVDDGLTEQLLLDADEMEACGAGNEAANMRKLVERLKAARRAALNGGGS